ncbi:MAG: hypothetical protein R2867_39735 [Caldilineaceae bacterium]
MSIYRSRQLSTTAQWRLLRRGWRVLTALALVLVQVPAMVIPLQAAPNQIVATAPLRQQTSTLTLDVVSARTEPRAWAAQVS